MEQSQFFSPGAQALSEYAAAYFLGQDTHPEGVVWNPCLPGPIYCPLDEV